MNARILAVVGLAIVLGGCSSGVVRPKVAPVTGIVTQKGKPLTEGDVMFTPSGGAPGAAGAVATGRIGPDGSYTLTTFDTGDGAVPGTYKVTVTATSSVDMKKLNKGSDGRIAYKLPPSLVSSKYSRIESTPLTHTVIDGNNTINIDLKE
jgi:hypothetical protein